MMTKDVVLFNTLSPSQKEVATVLLEYLENATVNDNKIDFIVLEGFAGTGKSYTLNRVIDFITSTSIAISAPTHKAVRVLRTNSERPEDFIFATIHSLLSLKQKISEKGIISYEADNYEDGRIGEVDILIVDEVSMLDPKLFLHLMDYKNKHDNLKIVFTGDPLQIPPVGEKQSYVFTDEVFNTYKVHKLCLTEPMRQAKDNPILKYATAIRTHVQEDIAYKDFLSSTPSFGIEELELDNSKFYDTVLPMFKEDFDNNQDHIKILAWTNLQVNKANDMIRSYRLDDKYPPKIVKGDYLVADKTISSNKMIIANTSEEMKVLQANVKTIKLPIYAHYTQEEMVTKALAGKPPHIREGEEKLWALQFINKGFIPNNFRVDQEFKVYDCTVEIVRDDKELVRRIQVIHEDSEDLYNTTLNNLKSLAFHSYSKKGAWKEYFKFQEEFASVKYNYALTVHKSQGSSYENCVVMLDDINRNRKVIGGKDLQAEERNRIKYVAVTRAKRKLFIIT